MRNDCGHKLIDRDCVECWMRRCDFLIKENDNLRQQLRQGTIKTSSEGTSYCTQCEAWAKECAELKIENQRLRHELTRAVETLRKGKP